MPFKIDLNQTFPHLPRAPIVEAVIHWRARAEKTLGPQELLHVLTDRLPDYPTAQPQHEIEMHSQFGPAGSSEQRHRARWHGFRFETADSRHVAQFTRNGFVFSRLQPYEDWQRFETEAQRLWRIYCELVEPSEVERLGVRFINLISPVEREKLDDLLSIPPAHRRRTWSR